MRKLRPIAIAAIAIILPLVHAAPHHLSHSLDMDCGRVCIKRLIVDLSTSSARLRESTAKELEGLGLPALELLDEAAESGNAFDLRLRAAAVAKKIRLANHLPPHVNGVEFKLIVGKEWVTRNQQPFALLHIALEFKNRRDKPICFSLPETMQYMLFGPKGQVVDVAYCGRERSMLYPDVTPPIKKNETFTFHITGVLVSGDGVFKVSFEDPFSDVWQSGPVEAGVCKIALIYGNDFTRAAKGENLWQGRVETLTEEVVVNKSNAS